MTPAQKNLAASSILLLLFGGASAHLARENTALQARAASPLERSGESTVSSTRSRRFRERTVGDLFHEYAAPKSARELLLEWSLTRNQVGDGKWKLSVFYFSQLSLSELLELQAELLTTGGPRWELQGLLHTLQARLHLQLRDEPARFFDHAIATSSVYGTTQHYFGKWIKEDPEAAVAWFRSTDPGKEFDAGRFESRQSRSRDNLRSVLLETLAETDLETALALVREENARGKSYLIPNSLQSKLIEQAATSGDDSALLDLLRSNPDSYLPLSGRLNDPESFWVRFTGATSDLDRSVTLLQSLEKPDGYGEAMAAIISTQADLPLPQQVDWLYDQIPDRDSRDQSVSHLLLGQDLDDPFSEHRVSSQTREWLDQQARRQENDPFLFSTATALSNTGIHLAAYEVASRLTRSQANESLVREFASRLYQFDEAAAARVLPPELLEQISTPQE